MSEFVHPEERLNKPEKEPSDKAARQRFRDLHKTDEGIAFLALELADLGWLNECVTEREQTLRDYANFIIRDKIGIRTPDLLKQLVRYMLTIGQ